MEIDNFTFIAQIINFVILLVLLRLTLYKPIIRVMKEREEAIKARLNDADEKYTLVEQQSRSLRQERQELDEQREQLMVEARSAAGQRRRELEAQAREQVEAERTRWVADVAQERAEFFERLKRRVATEVVSISREALSSLASADLEKQIINAFIHQLDALGEDERAALQAEAGAADRPLVVHSVFEIAMEERERIEQALGTAVGIDYVLAPELICGIELKTPRYELAWSVESYLDSLEPQLNDAFGEMAHDDTAAV